MAKRHSDALAIQHARNPSGIARALVKAIDETRSEGKVASEDAAVRLIAHQLAYILQVREIDDSPVYRELDEECRRLAEQ